MELTKEQFIELQQIVVDMFVELEKEHDPENVSKCVLSSIISNAVVNGNINEVLDFINYLAEACGREFGGSVIVDDTIH